MAFFVTREQHSCMAMVVSAIGNEEVLDVIVMGLQAKPLSRGLVFFYISARCNYHFFFSHLIPKLIISHMSFGLGVIKRRKYRGDDY